MTIDWDERHMPTTHGELNQEVTFLLDYASARLGRLIRYYQRLAECLDTMTDAWEAVEMEQMIAAMTTLEELSFMPTLPDAEGSIRYLIDVWDQRGYNSYRPEAASHNATSAGEVKS